MDKDRNKCNIATVDHGIIKLEWPHKLSQEDYTYIQELWPFWLRSLRYSIVAELPKPEEPEA